MRPLGKLLIISGLFLIVIGVVFYFGGSLFKWFGNLPGDIKVQKQNFTFYAPITSMILISLALTLIINLIIRILQK